MPTGPILSFQETLTRVPSIVDAIGMLGFEQAPLLHLLGYTAANKKKLGGPLTEEASRILKWMERPLAPTQSALSSGINGSVTTIPVTAGQGVFFRTGDIVWIDDEAMMVSAPGSANSFDVVARGYGGTANVSHSSAATVYIETRAMQENSAWETGYRTDTAEFWNHCQIISEAVSVSNTDMAVSKLGPEDALDYEVGLKFRTESGGAGELVQKLCKIFYRGLRVLRDGNNNGSAGGYNVFATTHTKSLAGASLQKEDLHERIRLIKDAGGDVTHIVGNSWMSEKLYSLYPAEDRGVKEAMGGAVQLRGIFTPHSKESIGIINDYLCPPGRLYLLNEAFVGWLPLRPFARSEAQQARDGRIADVTGEYHFFLRHDKSHALLTNISTNS